jgi:hypothetical protein
MSPDAYRVLESDFERLLSKFHPLLSREAVAAARHYVDCGELEMAVEVTCIDLFDSAAEVGREDRNELMRVSKALSLDTESVFEQDFWAQYLKHLA